VHGILDGSLHDHWRPSEVRISNLNFFLDGIITLPVA
jgi:hypothetical protein